MPRVRGAVPVIGMKIEFVIDHSKPEPFLYIKEGIYEGKLVRLFGDNDHNYFCEVSYYYEGYARCDILFKDEVLTKLR